MLSILLLDDDEEKVSSVVDFLVTVPGIEKEWIDVAGDLITGRERTRQRRYDLLLLDLRLPNRKGDTPSDTAGCEFVKELAASQQLLAPFHIIGLTQYEALAASTDPFFAEEIWRVILYDRASDQWKSQLRSKLHWLLQSQRSVASSAPAYDFDLAILTALRVPEHQAVLALPGSWQDVRLNDDSTIYSVGTFQVESGALKVVAATAPQIGMTAACATAMKLIQHFRPRHLVSTGIAAGVGEACHPGDLVIADQSWDYDSGKRFVEAGKARFEPDPRSIPLKVELKERFGLLRARNAYVADIVAAWGNRTPSTPSEPHVVIGPVASGGAVVQGTELVEDIRRVSRKLVGIDMESYGVFYAAEHCTRPRPTAFSIRAVSDFADVRKNDRFQAYAAFVGTQYLYRFSIEHLGKRSD